MIGMKTKKQKLGRSKIAFFLLLIFIITLSPLCTAQQKQASQNVQSQSSQAQEIKYRDITIKELKDMLDNGEDIILVDVRTEGEYMQGHLKGAINIPHYEIEDRYKEITSDKEKKIVTICSLGARSTIASEKLVKLGYKNVYNVMGGMEQWMKVYGNLYIEK